MRTPRPRLIAGLLLAPLLAGCFASSDGGRAADPDGSGDGGRLRVALAFPPAENYSPYGMDAYDLSRLGVVEGLTRLDANGSAAPALATSWSAEPDGTSWLFTLREATFQDGSEVTAQAVATALTHAARAEPAPSALSGVRLSAEAVGDQQVRVATAEADPVLPLRLTNPSLAVFAPAAYAEDGTVDPVGTATGPFALTTITGDTAATLDRFEDHWGGRAQASGIDARYISDGTARANALRTGEVDIAEAVPVAQVAALDEGIAHEINTARNTSLFLNTATGAFEDAGLRAAAREAIDPTAVAEGVYEGYAQPAEGIFGPALTWAAGKRTAPQGRAAATDPAGRALTIATYSDRPELPEAAQVVQQQLESAGFTVSLEVRTYARLESDLLDGAFDAAILARNVMLDTGDPVTVLASGYACDGSFNLSALCDAGVDGLIEEARTQSEPGARQDAALRAEAAILATDAEIPLVHLKVVTGIATGVTGAVLDPYEREIVGLGTRR